jgi:hypothetical protein
MTMHRKRPHIFVNRISAPFALAVALTFGLPAPALAVTACVTNSTELQQALNNASDAADDDIRLQTGNFQLSDDYVPFRGDFKLSGGWNSGCSLNLPLNNFSQINAQASNQQLRLLAENGEISVSRLIFSNFDDISLDQATGNVASGELLLERSRVVGARVFISTKSLSVRVQNSIISGHASTAILIINNTTTGARPDVLVQFNTIVQPTSPTSPGLIINGVRPLGRVDVYNNVINGHNADLTLLGQEMTVASNHYNTIALSNGASLSPSSTRNLSGNPGLNSLAPFAPVEPNAAVINSGSNTLSLPSRDFLGGVRLVGSRPDMGAIESSVNNSSEIAVTNLNDAGAGSLRAAITTANTNPALKTISFNISGSCPRTINLLSPLPALTRPVLIDGYTQPGSAPNEATTSFDGTLCVVLNGAATQANGLHLQTLSVDDEMTVRGLIFYGFSSEAVRISGPGKGSIAGNLFGTGAILLSNFADSVIRVTDAPGSTIGGLEPADRNVIGLGQIAGVRLEASTGQRSVVNNFIGTGRNGMSSLPNGVGILVEGGTEDSISRNWITDNSSHGVHINSTPISNRIRINNNRVGLRPLGLNTAGGNGGNGIRIGSGELHILGNNTIANNGTDGLVVLSGARRVLLGPNSFQRNTLQPIDLSPDGVNPIDLDVGQTGANDQQNTAEILSARGSSSQGEVRARLSSANGSYLIDLYFSSQCPNASGFVDGGNYFARSAPITLTCATASTNCTSAVTIPVTNSLLGQNGSLVGKYVTAMVIDEENNTSEFSACELYILGDNIFKTGFE